MSDARRTIAALKQVGAFVPHKLHRSSDASADGNGVHDPAAQTNGVDLEQWPNAQRLLDRCRDFFAEVEDLTPGKELEEHLNANYGQGNLIYEDLCSLTRLGLEEGWVANIEVDGEQYRRSKISLPSEENKFFSITTVYMSSDDPYRGQYHSHPYGEINCVVQLNPTAELMGMSGWQGAGWTSPGAGTHHYPEVRGGALIALFFLPAGRISYKKNPGDKQPLAF